MYVEVLVAGHEPSQKRVGDAGFDCRASLGAEKIELKPDERLKIPLGFKLAMPKGWVGLINERSGHAVKHGFHTIGNVIDPNYLGEVHAIVHNSGDQPVTIYNGDRVAQIVFVQCYQEPLVVVGNVENHSTFTDRGEAGFGSSGDAA